MAEAEQEAAEIASQADGLDINIGNLNSHTVLAMHRAIAAANQAKIPVVLDPGRRRRLNVPHGDAARLFCAISVFRRAAATCRSCLPSAVQRLTPKGVDAGAADAVTEENLQERVEFFKQLSAKLGAVVSVSGAIDIIASPERAYICRNGHPMMSCVTEPAACCPR